MWAPLHLDRTPQSKTLQLFKLEHWLYSAENFDAIHVLHQQEALLLDLPSESEGKDLVHIIYCYYPLNIKAKLLATGNFSLKQKLKTSTLVNFTLKV